MDGHFWDLLFYFSFHNSISDQYFSLCSYSHSPFWFKYVNVFYQVLKSSWSGSFLWSESKLINLFLLWYTFYLIFSGQWFLRGTLLRSTFMQPLHFRRGFFICDTDNYNLMQYSWDTSILDESGVSRKMTNKSLWEIWESWLVK